MTTTPPSSFPVGSSVLLQNLVKGAHLNDKRGIVKSIPNAASGRQEVYIFDENKSLSVKHTNLRYEPRELSSLSPSEMKGVLLISINMDKEPEEWSGMDKNDLRMLVKESAGEDSLELAKLVAKSNEPKEVPKPANTGSNSSGNMSGSTLREGAEKMASMRPDDIRRQAATMKAMGPAALRNMHPQMANMTDAQINMAISQMEAVANNPSQMKMAADQMKNMSDSDLNRAVNQSPLVPSATTATPASAGIAPTMNNVSRSQFEQATEQMSSMSPDQLRQQAQMLRNMPLDALRRTNPQMANMSDAQIEMSIQQLEQMAENPAMMKMAADQMKNMSESDYESMKNMAGQMGGGAASAATTNGHDNENVDAMGGLAGLAGDPSKMMESLLSNPEQLNTIVKTMKSNPEFIKQMVAQQGGGEAQKEQISKAIDSFASMDDAKLERYLKVANGVQRVASPVLTTFGKVKEKLGVSAKTLAILINLVFLACLVGLWRWWKMRNGGGDDDGTLEEDILRPPEIVPHGYEDGEF